MKSAGSEWRRWDLHIDTPGTLFNDQFGSWDEYLDAIECNTDVKVLGITDYMLLRNYSRLLRAQREGRIQNISLLVPNLEFRIAPPTDRSTAINIHLIVSPDDPHHERKIVEALGRLVWVYQGNRYSCVPEQLTALGQAFSPGTVDGEAALKIGAQQFKVDFSAFRDWFVNEGWLKANTLVAVSAGTDGLSGFYQDGGWAALRSEITRFSDIILSGRDAEIEFWLGQGTDEQHEAMRRLHGPKPCIHGSDAHSLERLFKPDKDRFCWIKADLTFNGLRQVLHEPAGRVHIGPTPPNFHDSSRVISTLRLSNSSGWFDDIELPINANLISIIGPKGSGKSAVAELIALAAGSTDGRDPASFLHRAGTHIKGMNVELIWGDRSSSRAIVGTPTEMNQEVRYLSQRFVEDLCSGDLLGQHLIDEIENVIFENLDNTDTLNASTFRELRTIRTKETHIRIGRLRENLIRIIDEEIALRDNEASVGDKKKRISALEEEKANLQAQIPEATSTAEEERRKRLSERREVLRDLEHKIGSQKQQLQKVSDVRSRLDELKSQISRFAYEIGPLLNDLGIPATEQQQFIPAFASAPEQMLERIERTLTEHLDELQGSREAPKPGTLLQLRAELTALVQEETEDRALREKLKIVQERLSTIEVEIRRIADEIAHIVGPESLRRKAAREERYAAYVGVFQCLCDEQSILESLYAPISAKLKSRDATIHEQKLEFSIRWQADIVTWLQRGMTLFDQRKKLPYESFDGIANAAAEILLPAWMSGNPDRIRPAMETFLAGFNADGLSPNFRRAGIGIGDIYKWLFEVGHIRLTYSLKYNGTELAKLSPGTKGTVLLILYLGMDTADTRPLIVDQPDDNLDNESIYSMLAPYFKQAKNRRQIILITHNPNLVVNTDSEQVVVSANELRTEGLPSFSYLAGALETVENGVGIRDHVCRILEGGAEAFRRRERRYELKQNE